MTSRPRSRPALPFWFALLATLLPAAPGSAAEVFAGRVTAENAAAWLVGGPDAVGGIGDYAIGNGTLCAVVSDPVQPTDVSAHGGFLLDLGHCALANDQLGNLVPLVNVSRTNVPRVREVTTHAEGDEARITTRARWEGIELTTDYVLAAAHPDRLRIETRATRVASGGRFAVLGLLSVHPNAALRAFKLDTEYPELTVGFTHPETPSENVRSLVGGLARANVQVLVGGETGRAAGVAYGLELAAAVREDADGSQEALPVIGLNGAPFSLLGVFSRPFWVGGGPRVGLLELVQSLFMNLSRDETLHLTHHVSVGRRSDVASVTDQLWPDGPEVTGQADDPSARLHVSRDGVPVTEVRPDADGRFAFRVPAPGSYEVRALAPGNREVRRPIEVAAAGAALGRVALGGAGRVRLPRGHAMRLVFEGLDGTADPRIGDDLLGLTFGGVEPPTSALANYVSLAGVADDPATVTLPPGRYRVSATRGLEWSVEQTEVAVRAGQDVPLTIGLPLRAFETPGWILADLHVHAAGSFDSTLPNADRIRSFVAQGGEVLVSTEHDNVVDYRPLVAEMGLTGVLHVIPGLEMTSIAKTEVAPRTAGHANVLPLAPVPFAHRGGALRSQGIRLRQAIAELRARGGRRIVQLNHPRTAHDEPEDEAFFTHLSVADRGFDPALPLDDAPNHLLLEADPTSGVRDLDFDAIELLNGKTHPELAVYQRTRADWFALLRQGERRTGTANSDSHKHRQLVAIPTNYVRVAEDDPARLDEPAFIEAILEGTLVGTTGPFLGVTLEGVEPGGRFSGTAGELAIAIDAADWVPVSELRVFVDGELRERRPVERGARVAIPLEFAADAFVTVEVQGNPREDAAARYRAVAPGFTPFAFSNPIFVDADGDGAWSPPGL